MAMICCRTSLVSWPRGAVGGGRRGAGCGGTGRRGAAMGSGPSERGGTGPAGAALALARQPTATAPGATPPSSPPANRRCPLTSDPPFSSILAAHHPFPRIRPKQPPQRLLGAEGCLGNRDSLLILPSPPSTHPLGAVTNQHQALFPLPGDYLETFSTARLGVAMVTTTASI